MKAREFNRMPTALLAKQESCVFVPSSELVPDEWSSEFWGLFNEGAPFTWGDNNVTLITLQRFVDHAAAAIEKTDMPAKYQKAYDEWMSRLEDMCTEKLAHLYIDLES